jgi:hypothetical protein
MVPGVGTTLLGERAFTAMLSAWVRGATEEMAAAGDDELRQLKRGLYLDA